MYKDLFSDITIKDLTLKNRLTMAPLYLGYAGEGGTVSDMLLEHYRLMAGSGVAMVVVENATVDHPVGSGSNRTLRADTDDNLDGSETIVRNHKKRRRIGLPADQPCGSFRSCDAKSAGAICGKDFWSDAQSLGKCGDRSYHRKICQSGGKGKNRRF